MSANVLGIISRFYFDQDFVYGLIPLFDFDKEKNIPTLFSSITLILTSLLLFFIALSHKKSKTSYLPWIGLTIIFLFLALDETSSIHEKLSVIVHDLLNTSGLFYYAWVIPYGLFILIFVGFYMKFLIHLPKKIMILFLLSGATYVVGALGFEMYGARLVELGSSNTILYSILYTVEELLEMLGITIFIYTLLIYIVGQFNSLTIVVTKSNTNS
ncbi:MAG: hypothetical protein ACXAD7_28965 [Candidatus Kariarchaeaceae archaeon]